MNVKIGLLLKNIKINLLIMI